MEKDTIYDVDYFIRKFSEIPENMWWVGDYSDGNPFNPRCCARGHCGKRLFKDIGVEEDDALLKLFDFNLAFPQTVGIINDGKNRDYQQSTPKKRILAALYDIKRKQAPEFNEPPVTVEDLIGQEAFTPLATSMG